jgi:glycosyltransferase involved in cell wall biosynthesis
MILLYILIAFASLRFLVVLVNLLTGQWLRSCGVSGDPSVSVLIPARNEEKNIAGLLDDLVGMNNSESPRIAEIIVYDDQSTDGTVQMIRSVRDDQKLIRVIGGDPLPDGWLGKNHACHRLAAEATGDWLLFLDADVKVSPNLIRDAIGYAQKKKVRLLSLFPQQEMITPGEWMVVPLMNWILLSLLPMALIRTCRWTSFAAANGQFMLFDASIYKRFQWHSLVKADPVEDIRISRLMKKKRFRTATLLSGGQISCRMYEDFGQALNGFSKNVGQFFGNSIPWMLLFLLLTSILPLALLLPFNLMPLLTGLYFLLLLLIRIGVSLLSRQNVLRNILFWIPQQIVLVILVWKSIRFRLGRKIEWKGRQV